MSDPEPFDIDAELFGSATGGRRRKRGPKKSRARKTRRARSTRKSRRTRRSRS